MKHAIWMAALLLLTGVALGATVTEPHSKTGFPASIELGEGDSAVQLDALGTGLRKKSIIKVYAACFYIARGQELGEDRAADAIHGDFAKRIDMYFLRKVGGAKIAGGFRDGVHKSLDGHDEALEAFCAMFTGKVQKHESIVLEYLPGRGLEAYQGGKSLGLVTDMDLIAALWATWFGADPVGEELKKGLLAL
ncbi:MAG: chalcone isomerase family protein [Candidatus Krumholzibacteria bacterium]|jgi:hypothetical protein|nr:chalcone isomerase family protein [Candidatus Krumholzibacteria bacterium]MDP6668399.1 chalcone isomerase family protein [Candidatus Krumholzibacteria bacterium]MDP6797968.1 chalcone isomerase family protein [Candidatus Krumholzibacteria bacterium]MDP7021877.1 chalcone isomerase family protein [Candidatus Krumholzibacteria bacterium]